MQILKQTYQFYTQLPGWAKGVVVVGGCAIAYFAAKSIFDRIKKDAAKKDSIKTVSDAKTELANLLKSGASKLSFPLSQYNTFAQKIFTAFDGWGTDNDQVASVFYQLKTKADVLQLIVSFGVRTIPSGKFNPTPDFTGDLSACLSDEMNQLQLTTINGYLASNKIDYKF